MKDASRQLKLLLQGVLLFVVTSCGREPAQQKLDYATEEKAIREVLTSQERAWNEGDIEKFMEGYWQSDSLQFVGATITRGWQATLDRYKASYPDRLAMGTLQFEFYSFEFVAPETCLVTGRYTLVREQDKPTGLFTLLIRKIGGKWVIAYDHTS